MKKTFVTITCMLASLIVGPFLFAQDGADNAKKILEDSKAKFDALKDFTSDFTYALDNPSSSSANVEKTGKIQYAKGKYAIVMEDQEIFCDGKKMWVYLPEMEEVNIMDYDPAEGMDIESIFSLYKTNARLRYDGKVNLNGHSCHLIYMTTLDESLEFNQVKLWVNEKTQLLEKAVTINRMQTHTTYEFRNMKTNQGLSDATFRFDVSAHPEVDVYDETEN